MAAVWCLHRGCHYLRATAPEHDLYQGDTILKALAHRYRACVPRKCWHKSGLSQARLSSQHSNRNKHDKSLSNCLSHYFSQGFLQTWCFRARGDLIWENLKKTPLLQADVVSRKKNFSVVNWDLQLLKCKLGVRRQRELSLWEQTMCVFIRMIQFMRVLCSISLLG